MFVSATTVLKIPILKMSKMLNSTNSWPLNYFCFKNESLRILLTQAPPLGKYKCTGVVLPPTFSLSHPNPGVKLYIIPALAGRYLVLMPLSGFSGLQRNVVHLNLAHITVTVFFL